MIGNRLKELRKNKGLTQQELADDLNVSGMTISNYEQGQRKPDSDFISAAAKYFHVSSDFLLGLTNAKKKKNIDVGNITGLSDFAIDVLEQSKKETNSAAADIINTIIQSAPFIKMIKTLYEHEYEKSMKEYTEYNGNILELKISDFMNLSIGEKESILKEILPSYIIEHYSLYEHQINEHIDEITKVLKMRYTNNEGKTMLDILQGV